MTIGSMPLLGILLALLSAAVLAVGNLLQSSGIKSGASDGTATDGTATDAQKSGSIKQLVTSRKWLWGTALFGVAIVLQMASLAFAPLILVQPVGVAALVFTALITAKVTGKRPTPAAMRAIVIALVGVTAYVVVAAMVSSQKPISDRQLVEMLITLLGVLIASAVLFFLSKGTHQTPVMYVILGGVYSGFVATLGKTVLLRVEDIFKDGSFHFGHDGWLTILCIIGIGVASALSIFYVQYSHTCNEPDVVVAGLTVIDPAIAVILGITILQEAAGAPIWSTFAFIVAGAIAFTGVFQLAQAEEQASPPGEKEPQEAVTAGE